MLLIAFLSLHARAWAAESSVRSRFSAGGYTHEAHTFLLREDVRKELDLSAEQQSRLDSWIKDWASRRRWRMPPPGLSPNERQDWLRKQELDLFEQRWAELEDILLPHQLERLGQLKLQYRVGRPSFELFAHAEFAEELGLTPQQVRATVNRAEQLRREQKELFTRFDQEAMKRMMELLTDEQRQRYEEMLGKPFVFWESKKAPLIRDRGPVP